MSGSGSAPLWLDPLRMTSQVQVERPDNYRQIRAAFTDHTITEYQAYSPAIAEAALRAGCFVPPFKRQRMTWIKPSFLWLTYRCGLGAKPGQERVLAVEVSRLDSSGPWGIRTARPAARPPSIYSGRGKDPDFGDARVARDGLGHGASQLPL